MCTRCKKTCGGLLLALGVLFLLVDFGVWSFWGIQWWSALLVLAGVSALASGHCPDCANWGMPAKKRK